MDLQFYHPQEEQRLKTLHSLGLLDTGDEAGFDRITNITKRLFRSEVSLVSLVDADRQWFKSMAGTDLRETHRELSLCTYVVGADMPLFIEDMNEVEGLKDHPLVVDEPKYRSYAGCPLRASNGMPLGALCVVDKSTRRFSSWDKAMLEDMAKLVDGSSVEVRTVHFFNRCVGRLGIGKSHKTKSTGASRITIRNNFSVGNLSKAFKSSTELMVVGVPAQ